MTCVTFPDYEFVGVMKMGQGQLGGAFPRLPPLQEAHRRGCPGAWEPPPRRIQPPGQKVNDNSA